MLRRTIAGFVILAGLVVASTNLVAAHATGTSPDALTAHEWGTFTTVAGENGQATDWLPLGGPTDLPCFVEHFNNNPIVKVLPTELAPVDYATARSSLWGKVRMETPVLYFYAPRELSVDVRVRFPRGLMTEWYPHANVTQPFVSRSALRNLKNVSVIEWPNVRVLPAEKPAFPVENGASHYYAARATQAAPLRVGAQSEKFLFYRGVADFDVPLTATALGDGSVRIRNLSSDSLPNVVLFEKRGGAIGYRIHGSLTGETTIAAPTLDGNFDTLRGELEQMLVTAGLFPREAAAMVDTWRDSWFEDGTRVFYIVPPRAIESILPLQVTPAPARIARVFVGRMEVLTPAVQQSVESAITRGDGAVLERYGRFLGPIADRLLAKTSDASAKARIHDVTTAAFASYLKRAAVCE